MSIKPLFFGISILLAISALAILMPNMRATQNSAQSPTLVKGDQKMTHDGPTEIAIFAGGCFWCMQPPYDELPGIIDTIVGYTGGTAQNPRYQDIGTGQTGHAEVVKIIFDPTQITYPQLLDVFWRNIDPTAVNRQFADVGSQYRTAIFPTTREQATMASTSKAVLDSSGKFKEPIATTIEPFTVFYPAEQAHQDFYKNNPLRYNQYKVGSGRAGYIKKTWQSEN